MQLTSEQIRRYYLAGTIPLPAPFPKLGRISIETDTVQFPPNDDERSKTFVVVQATHGLRHASIHLIKPSQVAALFIPARQLETGEGGPPQNQRAKPRRRIDFDEGKWYLTPDIKAAILAGQLPHGADKIQQRSSPLRGIVFVRKQARILTMREISHTAARAAAQYSTAPDCDCDCYATRCDVYGQPSWCDCD